MKRVLLTAVAALAAVAAGLASRSAPEAEALAAAQVASVYKLKLKGDGWWRGTTEPYRMERVNGTALLVLARNVPDDGKFKVSIQLDSALTRGAADLATPTPDFQGTGLLIGDSMTVIASGAPTYVNAVTLTFLKNGARVIGHWCASYPPSDAAPDSSSAGAFGAALTGRRLAKREMPVSAVGAAGR